MSSNVDFLSPFEELVLTAISEIGNGATNVEIWRKVRELSGRARIPLTRVEFNLHHLERDCCVYSWSDGKPIEKDQPWVRQYRVQFAGERALQAAIKRRGTAARDYFYRASRFGVLWDFWRILRCRYRAEAIAGHDGKPIIF